MKKLLLPIAAFSILLASCGGSVNSDGGNTDTTPTTDTMAVAPTADAQGGMRNNIQVSANGLTVTQAYLQVSGASVPDDNKVNANDRVDLHLSINGWKSAPGGKLNIGASQLVRNSAGKVLLDDKDIFVNQPISVEDAGKIILSAAVPKADTPNDTYTVTFRVWDKDNGSDVSGTYTFSHK